MRVPDNGNVVIGIEIATAVGGVDPRSGSPHDLQRFAIEQGRELATHRGRSPIADGRIRELGRRDPRRPAQPVEASRQLGRVETGQQVEPVPAARHQTGEVLLVVRVQRRPPGRHEHTRGEPGEHKLTDQLHLVGLQRQHSLVRVQERAGRGPRVGGLS
jgi:hypothetical protein